MPVLGHLRAELPEVLYGIQKQRWDALRDRMESHKGSGKSIQENRTREHARLEGEIIVRATGIMVPSRSGEMDPTSYHLQSRLFTSGLVRLSKDRVCMLSSHL